MVNTILKIIEYVLGLLFFRSKSDEVKINNYNKDLQNEKDKHNKIINESFEKNDLEKIRKEAAE